MKAKTKRLIASEAISRRRVFEIDFALTEEQEQFRSVARTFAQENLKPATLRREWIEDPRDRYPWDLIEAFGKLGFRELTIPESYGGIGASTLTAALVAEEFAAGDAAFAISVSHCWRDTKLVAGAGTQQQKEWFFGEYVKDHRFLTSLAMTEPAHGSDSGIPYPDTKLNTTAELTGDKWVVNGRKRFVGNGNVSKLLFVMACTDSAKRLPEGSSLIMVPRATPGLEVEEIYDKIGLRMSNNVELTFSSCQVSKDMLLGPLNKGYDVLGQHLRSGEAIRASIAVGLATSAYEAAMNHARERVQGGKPIIDHQAVGTKLARMATMLETARTMAWRYAWSVDAPQYFDKKLGYMANYFATRQCFEVCTMAMEILALDGILRSTPGQKYMRDAVMMLSAGGPVDNLLLKIHNALTLEQQPR